MEVVIVQDAAEAGELVGAAVASLVNRRPDAVLGLSTGASPLPVYRELVRRHEAGQLSFARTRAFLLDEYVGLPPGHPARYRSVIERELVSAVDFAARAVQVPDVDADDLLAACECYEASIWGAGGVDLQLLGVGADGHIGFNEPGSSLASRTRIKTLTDQTRRDNARFFRSDGEDGFRRVPQHVVTQGIGTILDARHLILLGFGAGKARAIAEAVEGPVTAMIPASALQLHPHVTVVIDEPAAAGLRLGDYYRETWAGKPAWQGL